MPMDVRELFPLTHEQAVGSLLEADWSREDRVRFMEASGTMLHDSVGLALRTYWYLTEKTSPLSRHYQRRFGLGHADDMSRLILRHFVSELRNLPFDLEAEVECLRRHWQNQGVDPLTLERE